MAYISRNPFVQPAGIMRLGCLAAGTASVNSPPVSVSGAVYLQAQRLGFGPELRAFRSLLRREYKRWIDAGCPSPPPDSVKTRIIETFLASGPRIFIETGTLTGATLDRIARLPGVFCYSIEIEARLFSRAKNVFRDRPNIELILGDSALALPPLLENLAEPALFWLDGHYSGGISGRGECDTPIAAELDAILAHPRKDHRILIDDARLFDGTGGYPRLSELLARFEDHSSYRASVSADIIRITPRPPRTSSTFPASQR